MNSTSSHGKLNLRELSVLALMAALIFASKVAMAALPNIHLVAVLLILTAITFGWKSLYTVFVYVMLEGLVFGFGTWWFAYVYVWPLLVVLAIALRKAHSYILYTLLAGVFGILFGALCLPAHLVMLGWKGAFNWWLAGVPYDLIHGVSNLVLTLILLPPMDKLLNKLKARLRS